MRTPSLLVCGAALGLALVAACGSTVPPAELAGAARDEGLGRSGPGGVPGDAASASAAPTGGPTGRGTASAAATAEPGRSTPLAASSADPAMPRGTVSVGVVYDEGTDSYARSFGLGFLSTGDGRAQGQAFVEHLNATGGLGGRRVVPVFAPMSTADASGSGPDQAQAAVCARLTQDNRVAFAVGNLAPQPSFLACLHRAGVPYVTGAATLSAQTAASVAPHLYLPGSWLLDRLVALEVTHLVDTGFLTRTSRVGLMHYDTLERTRVADEVVKPLLARLGIPLAAQGSVAPTPEGNGRFAGLVLAFRNAGVDRVLTVSTSPLLFMQAAEAQQYRPRYAVNSAYGPAAALEQNAPGAQLVGAQGVGWEPLSDVTGARTGTAQETTCRAVLHRAGQLSDSPVTALYQLRFCDGFAFLQTALRSAHGPLDATALAAGVRRLGDGFVPAATFRSAFPEGRPDGAAAFRGLRFDEACSCFRYAGGVQVTR